MYSVLEVNQEATKHKHTLKNNDSNEQNPRMTFCLEMISTRYITLFLGLPKLSSNF
jgi:hypothetical protein